MKLEIMSCRDCPLFGLNNLSQAICKGRRPKKKAPFWLHITEEMFNADAPPRTCPLRRGPVVVALKRQGSCRR